MELCLDRMDGTVQSKAEKNKSIRVYLHQVTNTILCSGHRSHFSMASSYTANNLLSRKKGGSVTLPVQVQIMFQISKYQSYQISNVRYLLIRLGYITLFQKSLVLFTGQVLKYSTCIKWSPYLL